MTIGDRERDERPAGARSRVARPAETAPGLDRRAFLRTLGAAGGLAALAAGAGPAAAQPAAAAIPATPALMTDLLSRMLRARLWEEAMKEAFLAGRDGLYGAFHMQVGQEAVAAGVCAALTDADFIVSNHRGHGHLIAKGADMGRMTAELMFRAEGYSGGMGGSMHMADPVKGILGTNGIVGAQYLIAAGAAYGIRVRGTDQVAVAFGGEGSTAQGWFWSALRGAATYRLPVVFVVENNLYQERVPYRPVTPVADIADYARGPGIAGETVDGMDALAVHDAALRAVARARAGEGPSLIEARTYAFYDHNGFAGVRPGVVGASGLSTRPQAEADAWMARDPIPALRARMIANGLATEAELAGLEATVAAEVAAALAFGRAGTPPEASEGLAHVTAAGPVRAAQALG